MTATSGRRTARPKSARRRPVKRADATSLGVGEPMDDRDQHDEHPEETEQEVRRRLRSPRS
jgi:hypothetical protein